MDRKLHEAAREGDINLLTNTLRSPQPPDLTCSLTPQKNTVLHIAVRFKQVAMVEEIIKACPSLVSQPNSKGDTPLHMVARAGHLLLTQIVTGGRPTASPAIAASSSPSAVGAENFEEEEEEDLEAGPKDEIERAEESGQDGDLEMAAKEAEDLPKAMEDAVELANDVAEVVEEGVPAGGNLEESSSSNINTTGMVLKMRNCEGNTAIHEALKNRHEQVAFFLLGLDGDLACEVNNAGESPIYLAAEAGLNEVVSEILLRGPATYSLAGPDGQTPLHIAVIRCRLGAVKNLVKSKPELVIRADNFGKTALHYAATMFEPLNCSKLKIFRHLLSANRSAAYICDKDHNTPLHLTSKLGYRVPVRILLESCPDSAEIVDRTGRNVFHLAAMKGYCSTLKYLLKRPELKEMVNEADDDGNRPIHLAIQNNMFWVTWNMTGNKFVDCGLTNKLGLTALDVLELNSKLTIRQALIRHRLRQRKAPTRGRFEWITKLKPKIIVKPSVATNKIFVSVLVLLIAIFLRQNFSPEKQFRGKQ